MNEMQDIRKIERISKALGDPYRLKIMEKIRESSEWLPCTAILDLIDLSQSTVSHHMKQLVDAGLLIAEKECRNTKYQLNQEVASSYLSFLQRLEK